MKVFLYSIFLFCYSISAQSTLIYQTFNNFKESPTEFKAKNFNNISPEIVNLDSATFFKVYKTKNSTKKLIFKELYSKNILAANSLIVSQPSNSNYTNDSIWNENSKEDIIYYYDPVTYEYCFENIIIIDSLSTTINPKYLNTIILDSNFKKYSYFLSYFSGNEIGCRGSYASQNIKTSYLFKDIIEYVEPHNLILFLKAVNPYISVQAALYYYNHKSKFRKYKKDIKPIIEELINTKYILKESAGCTCTVRHFIKTYTFESYIKENK